MKVKHNNWWATPAQGDMNIGANSLKTTNLVLAEQATDRMGIWNSGKTAFRGLVVNPLQMTASGSIESDNTDGALFLMRTRDTGAGLVNVARAVGAADPYFEGTLGIRLAPVAQWGTPVQGALIYNSGTNKLNFYNGSAWEVVTSA